MNRNVVSLSSAETEFLSTMAAKGRNGFTVEEAKEHWDGDSRTARRLARLADKGWLERLERGKYMIVPLEAGPDRRWTEDAYVLATYLVDPSATAYWSALHYWNLTEQVPRLAYVQTTAEVREHHKEVLGIQFRLVKLKEEKFFGLKHERLGNQRFAVTRREKTILDGLDRPGLTGGIHEVAKGLRNAEGELDWTLVDEYLPRLGSGAVVKRLGYLVETMELGVPDRSARLSRWRGMISAGISDLDPSSRQNEGRIVTRWGIRVNLDVDGLGVEG